MAEPRWKAFAWKDVETQTEVPLQHASAQVSVCSECQNLALAVQGDRDSACVLVFLSLAFQVVLSTYKWIQIKRNNF